MTVTHRSSQRVHPMIEALSRDMAPFEKRQCPPVLALAHGAVSGLANVPIATLFTDPAASLAAQLSARKRYGYADPPSLLWADFGAHEFGGQLHLPQSLDEMAPLASQRPVRCSRDVHSLEHPLVEKAGSVPLVLEFCRLSVSQGMPAVVRAGTPTLVAASVAGMSNLGSLVESDRPAVHWLYSKVTAFLIDLIDAVIDTVGAQNVWPYVGAACDSARVVDKALVRELGASYQEDINRHLLRRGVQRAFVHLCGDHRDRLDVWASLTWPGPCLFSMSSSCDLVEAIQRLGKDHAICGNVSTPLLSNGTPDQVFDAARRCVEIGRSLPGRFALAPECDLPVRTPAANLTALVEAARMPRATL